MLAAATTPLDIIKGQRFLQKYEKDKSLKPDPSLPKPVVDLLVYPDVVFLMSDDLDWTEALGQAVLVQQGDVLQAIQVFRRKAQDAGNLKTDDKQVVAEEQDVVKIIPAQAEVIYVRGAFCHVGTMDIKLIRRRERSSARELASGQTKIE